MNEQDFKNYIKTGVKTPTSEFTDKLMIEISALPNKALTQNKWMSMILLFACFLILILSIFISIPQLQAFNFSIKFSPVIMPIIGLVFTYIIFQQLYDTRSLIRYASKNKVIKHLE
jgi:hypothetical protein